MRLWPRLGAWAVPGVVLAAAYLLWLYQRVFFGTVTNPKNEKLQDLTPREVATFVPLIIMAFWIGLYPKPFFEILEQPVKQIVATVRPDYPQSGGAVNASLKTEALVISSTVGAPQPARRLSKDLAEVVRRGNSATQPSEITPVERGKN